ncbi:restriction endonuclease subunit S [Psychrobacter sp. T6-6]|uniref:restriction endonuclease subunit S n=1 Tax=Psychrobacter sp. T6-6 TaxID=3457452 RepID=UPI003FCFF7E8
MVPKGWERKPIKELCESIIDCVNKTAKHVDYITPYKMIRTTNVRHGKVDTENVRYVDEDVYQQWIRRGAPQDGDIIFTREAPVGEAGILENSGGIFLGQRTMMYRVNPKVANNRFVFYSLMSGYCQKQIEDLSNGGTVAHMRVPDCGEIIINSPPFPEQQKIAKILSTWDKAIGATERLIENSTQQKKALMQQLLTGKKRLLDESGKRFESEWKERAVSSLGKIYSGGTPSTSNTEYWDGDINWITPTDITKQDSRYINSSLRKITLEGLKNSSAKLVPAGSLLICTRATIGAMAITSHEMCTNQGFKNIVPNSKTNIEFVYYLLTYNKHRMISKASGSTFLELSKTSFESMKFRMPPLKEQQKIATVLTNADKEIELLEQQLADLQQEKKALMQVLLTGKKRVVVDEC